MLVSSANILGMAQLRQFGKSLIYTRNNNGPKFLPCGTPQVTGFELDNLVAFLFIMTVSDLLEQPCDKSDVPSSLLQVINSLTQTCYNNWEQAVRRQFVDSLRTYL